MFQIGHRLSYDFDVFSYSPVKKNVLYKVKQNFGSNIYIETETSDILSIKTNKGVVITFVFHPYKAIKKCILTPSISLFHLDDLAANKAYTIGRRGAWRDYVDLFFFLKWNFYSIDTLISLATKKFGGEFNEKLFLSQLTYFADIDIVSTVYIKEKYSDDEIKAFLEKKVHDYIIKRF